MWFEVVKLREFVQDGFYPLNIRSGKVKYCGYGRAAICHSETLCEDLPKRLYLHGCEADGDGHFCKILKVMYYPTLSGWLGG
jgi:hypothetical protein